MNIQKKHFLFITACFVIVSTFSILTNPIHASQDQVEDHQIIYGMYWVNENGKPINEDGSPLLAMPRSTFYGNCGSAVLRAERSFVTVVIRPYGWVIWNFSGRVYDSKGRTHGIKVFNVADTTWFTLKSRGPRTLTLTGTAKDITGSTCSVVPNASIYHSW